MLAWLGFVTAFVVLRALTFVIHAGIGFGDVHVGGVHLHHYVWGILLLMIVGFCSFLEMAGRWRPWLGLAYGIGLALVVDEFALLLELDDVYWQREGRWSVDLALAVIGVGGSLLAIARTTHEDEQHTAGGHSRDG
ncbi:hypothetical protein [Paractinoplanes hotanensis]|uniref:Integral membrane protein n=1 Tax=Paractinoplanes hotanensis TaxID=2906497 RepID=A0ABT0YDJ4_9ACTN|nr:hypothetical protein [Actinoplanes hotanensis]MCM4083825.1 hypothetical protein [Actinoplanes hotanensis]